MNLQTLINSIQPADDRAKQIAKNRWDSIAKPLNSLGILEDTIIKIAGIKRTDRVTLNKKALVIMCADNGVVKEKVTQTDSSVTAVVAKNFLSHTSCACIMAKHSNTDVYPIDMGMLVDVLPETDPINKGKKVAYGTKNMAIEPAMTREEAIKAIKGGINTVLQLKELGYDMIATGEMGIGNTTTSSALCSVLLDEPVEKVTGKGAGLTKEGLSRKIEVIKKSISIHNPEKEDPIDVLSKVGGYDIAGLTGVFLGGAIYHVPIVLDGFISSVAALIAKKLNPFTVDYMIASHVSKEPGGHMVLEELDLRPFITADMCLGEGTGAVASFPLIEMALSVYQTMSTFSEINMEEYKHLS